MTRSLSNMIKAYSVRYKEEMRVVDVTEREEAIHAKVAEVLSGPAFVGGLRAIALEAQEGETLPDGTAENMEFILETVDEEGQVHRTIDRTAMEAWKAEEYEKMKTELLEAEKLALRIEMEKEIRTQADVILEQARAQGEQLKVKSKLAAEAEKLELFETAKREGYEQGQLRLRQEQERLEAEYAQKEQQLLAEYESKTQELEPKATEVIIGLLKGLSGVCLENKKGIVSYLVSNALSDADRSTTFLIKTSKDDFEEVKASAEQFRKLFDREVTLEIVQDSLLHKGECMIETDTNIIDCSLGTQLEGLIEDIRLLSVQERE